MAPESFLVGLAGFGAYIVIYLLLLRLKSPIGWLGIEVLTGIVVFGLSVCVGYWTVDGFSFLYAGSLFVFCWFCFFFVTGIFYVSVSVGIIHYLNIQPGKSATKEELYQECVRKPFINRIHSMTKLGLIEHSEQGYSVTSKGRFSVERIKNLQKILGLKSEGFYSANLGEQE